MDGSIDLTARRRAAGDGSRHEREEGDPRRSRLSIERQLAKLASFLLTWLAAFLMIVGLFSAFAQQLKAMSLELRALTVSGVFVVAMNFLVVPAITRLVSRWSSIEPRA